MLRILGGEAKGRKLKGPKKLDFRPMTGRVKEFIFTIIGSDIKDAVVLDLFSGSGSLGIEALSRGAGHAIMVEHSLSHVRMIEQNLEKCQYQKQAQVIKGDVFQILNSFGRRKIYFDIIVADPPFKMMLLSQISESVDRNQLLKFGGRLIIEHQDNDLEGMIKNIQLVRQKKFGHCMVSVYA